jgi:hypothetical protein
MSNILVVKRMVIFHTEPLHNRSVKLLRFSHCVTQYYWIYLSLNKNREIIVNDIGKTHLYQIITMFIPFKLQQNKTILIFFLQSSYFVL